MGQNEINDKDQFGPAVFVRVGIVILSAFVVMGLGAKLLPKAISVSSTGGREDLPIYCVNTEEKKVSLTFDAAWGKDDIQEILDILEEQDVKATFFMTGQWVSKYPEEVKAIAAAGHDLGNHGENHEHMTELSKNQQKEEILQVHKKVKELTGIEMNLFRAPFGHYNNSVVRNARDLKYKTIQWDVDVYATTLKPQNIRV